MANWGSGASGAVSGASTGASIGSIIPGVGTAIGGAVGGLFGGLTGLFGSKKKKKKKPKTLSTLDPNQQKLNDYQNQSILGEGPLADLYNYNPEQANDVFDKTIANPAYRNFKENVAPEITGAFRSNGLMNSSYSGEALGRAGRDVQQGLDARRYKYLYDEQNNAREAKRNAVENVQNRQTFAYQQPYPDSQENGKNGFSIDNILNSVSGNNVDSALGWVQDKALKYLPGGV